MSASASSLRAALVEEGPAARRARHDQIVEHARADDQPLAGSVAGQIGDALRPGLGRNARAERRADELHLAGLERRDASGDLEDALDRPLL